jgi:ethanolamine utilization protein EutS
MQWMAQNFYDALSGDAKARIIQEFVPGKQVTLAHIIANPDETLYAKLGLDPAVDYSRSAIGIVNLTPAETTIIAGDIATKASGVQLGFVDRFSGTLIVTGTVSEVEAAMNAIVDYSRSVLGFAVCPVTKT